MNIPVTAIRTCHAVEMIPIEALQLENDRAISIVGEITSESAYKFMLEYSYLKSKSNEPIRVLISSAGGSVVDGMAIYDIIHNSEIEITTICFGQCASMGAILFNATKGLRKMLPHSQLMIHEPLLSSGVGGNTTSILRIADGLEQSRKMLAEILCNRTGKAMDDVLDIMSYDHYFSASEALSWNLCDEIIETL